MRSAGVVHFEHKNHCCDDIKITHNSTAKSIKMVKIKMLSFLPPLAFFNHEMHIISEVKEGDGFAVTLV